MRRVLRQDPDVILIGEMRDEETVRTALSAAETGHLVLSTVHTLDATETINRIIDFFPPHLQHQARVMLSSTLKGAIAQRLVPDVTGEGRVPASEVLVVTGRVQDLILNPEETGKITEVIAEGEYYGMRTFDQALLAYVDGGPDHRGGGARIRLQPARLQTDARRRRPARQRHRAARPRAGGVMRDKLNNSPAAQIGLIGVLIALGAFFLLGKGGGGGAEESASPEVVATVNGTTATGATAGEAVEGAVEGLEEGAEAGTSAVAMPTSVPAPPPPAPFTAAYESGDTVVLLIVHDGGIDDALTTTASAALAGVADTSLFVVPAHQIARYAAVTDRARRQPRAGAGRDAAEAPQRRHSPGDRRLRVPDAAERPPGRARRLLPRPRRLLPPQLRRR